MYLWTRKSLLNLGSLPTPDTDFESCRICLWGGVHSPSPSTRLFLNISVHTTPETAKHLA